MCNDDMINYNIGMRKILLGQIFKESPAQPTKPNPNPASQSPSLALTLTRPLSPSRRYLSTQPPPLCPVSLSRARSHPPPLSPSVPLLVSVRRLSPRQRRWRREAKRVVVRRRDSDLGPTISNRSPLSLSPVPPASLESRSLYLFQSV